MPVKVKVVSAGRMLLIAKKTDWPPLTATDRESCLVSRRADIG